MTSSNLHDKFKIYILIITDREENGNQIEIYMKIGSSSINNSIFVMNI